MRSKKNNNRNNISYFPVGIKSILRVLIISIATWFVFGLAGSSIEWIGGAIAIYILYRVLAKFALWIIKWVVYILLAVILFSFIVTHIF